MYQKSGRLLDHQYSIQINLILQFFFKQYFEDFVVFSFFLFLPTKNQKKRQRLGQNYLSQYSASARFITFYIKCVYFVDFFFLNKF